MILIVSWDKVSKNARKDAEMIVIKITKTIQNAQAEKIISTKYIKNLIKCTKPYKCMDCKYNFFKTFIN